MSDRQVLVICEPVVSRGFWLVDYFPELFDLTVEAEAPTVEEIGRYLHIVDVQTMWIPADCRDGVADAYWCRPEAYTDPAMQRSMSMLALLPEAVRARGAARLASDLHAGSWNARHAHLLEQTEADYGYRLVVGVG